MNWRTPVKPLPDDGMWEVWHDEWAGTFEFFCGPRKAQELINGGMNMVNNKPARVEVVGQWPELNAVQLRVTTGPAVHWQQH